MKFSFAGALLFLFFCSGCAGAPTASPSPRAASTLVPPEATVAPNSPVPTVTAGAQIESASPSAQTSTPPALATKISETPAPLNAPAILARFNLLALPGQGRKPVALAQLGNTLYVANRNSNNIAIVRQGQVTDFLALSNPPVALLADAKNNRILAATTITPTLVVVENKTVVRTLPLSDSAQSLALSGDRLFIGSGSSAVIQVRDATTLEPKSTYQLSQGFDVKKLVVDSARHRLYANVYGRIIVLELDSLRQLDSIAAPYLYGALALNSIDGSIWAGTFDEKTQRSFLVAFDSAGKEIQRVPAASDLSDAVFDSQGRLFVASTFANQVAVVEAASGRVLANIPVDRYPSALQLDEENRRLYVANQNSDNLSVVDNGAVTAIGVIPLAMNVHTLLADEARARVYVASGSTDSVYVIEKGKVVAEVPVGHDPVDLAQDIQTNRLFVANYADGALSIVDENSLKVEATLSVTRTLPSVAVDAKNNHLFADSTIFTLDKLQREGDYLARGFTIGALLPAEFVRVNPERGKFYVFASNGVPGSNGRIVPYTFSETNFAESKPLPMKNGGNITALAIDPTSARVYGANTHPLSYRSGLDVWDADGNAIADLPLTSRTSGIAINPRTNHLFLAHAFTYEPVAGSLKKRDNALQILDTRSLGEVAWLDVPGAPGPVTLLGDTIYVAGLEDGAITLIGDASTVQPPAPPATRMPYPFPSPVPTGAPVATITPAPVAGSLACAWGVPEPFRSKWEQSLLRLGCPTVIEPQSGQFAFQKYAGGAMFDDLRNPVAKTIYSFFSSDFAYRVSSDAWNENMPSDSCPDLRVNAGEIKPIRGFGKVWCGESTVQGRLGGATGDEQLVTLSIQRFERGAIWVGSPFGPIAVFDDGTWR